jgi:hypothetical protein
LTSAYQGLTRLKSSGKIALASHKNAGVVQLVECLLAKEKVVGSSPIARSKQPLCGLFFVCAGMLSNQPLIDYRDHDTAPLLSILLDHELTF